MSTQILLTCEHGGSRIPAAYEKLFKKSRSVLKTHRALDIGALKIAQDLKPLLKSNLHFSEICRLVVDLNRGKRSKTLFSEFTEGLDFQEKQKILSKYYTPYWEQFKKEVQQIKKLKKQILHVSIHSMTHHLFGKPRKMQIALLYDTQKQGERKFSLLWFDELRKAFPEYKIARNNPYKVYHWHLPCAVKESCREGDYIHVELEMNQKLLQDFSPAQRKQFSKKLAESLKRAEKRFADL